MHRTVFPYVMSAPEEISYGILQWIWLSIKFVTSQELEILPHFLYPCNACVYLVMLVCFFYFSSPCSIIFQVIDGVKQVCVTSVMSLILSFKRRNDSEGDMFCKNV